MNETLREILRELYRLSTLCDQQAAALREKEAEVARLKAAVLPPTPNQMAGNGHAAVPAGAIERTRE